jgi:hypothetical protein
MSPHPDFVRYVCPRQDCDVRFCDSDWISKSVYIYGKEPGSRAVNEHVNLFASGKSNNKSAFRGFVWTMLVSQTPRD